MKRRARALVVPRIVVTLELQTDWSVRSLRSARWWQALLGEIGADTMRVLQAQA